MYIINRYSYVHTLKVNPIWYCKSSTNLWAVGLFIILIVVQNETCWATVTLSVLISLS